MASEEEKRLLADLFHSNNHDISVRPVRNYSEPSTVKLTLTLYQLIEIVRRVTFLNCPQFSALNHMS